MKNYQADVYRYQPKPKGEVDNNKMHSLIILHYVKYEFNNCFIIYLKED